VVVVTTREKGETENGWYETKILKISRAVCPTRSCTANDVTVRFTVLLATKSTWDFTATSLAVQLRVGQTTPADQKSFHPYLQARKWALVVVSVFHASLGKASGLVASLPLFQAFLVFEQVSAFTVAPSRGGFPTVLARNPLSCRLYVSLGIVATFENFVATGAAVASTLLLDGPSSCARCFDQDTRGRKAGR
jgi:hypothetical protein